MFISCIYLIYQVLIEHFIHFILFNRAFLRIGPIEFRALIEAANYAIEEAARLEYKKLRVISSGLSLHLVDWMPQWKANGWCKLINLFNPLARREPIEHRDIIVKLDDLLRINRQNNMVIEFRDDFAAFAHFLRNH